MVFMAGLFILQYIANCITVKFIDWVKALRSYCSYCNILQYLLQYFSHYGNAFVLKYCVWYCNTFWSILSQYSNAIPFCWADSNTVALLLPWLTTLTVEHFGVIVFLHLVKWLCEFWHSLWIMRHRRRGIALDADLVMTVKFSFTFADSKKVLRYLGVLVLLTTLVNGPLV